MKCTRARAPSNVVIELPTRLRDEPWGIRRFFVLDPIGVIINVSSHLQR
jgi:hypothetical protein